MRFFVLLMVDKMNKQVELMKNTFILTIGKIGTQFISFLLLPLYTALLTTSEYGIIDLFNTYISLLVPIFNWQFDQGMFRFLIDCRESKKKQAEVITTVLITNLIQTMIYLMIFFMARNFIHSEYKYFLAINVVMNVFVNSLLQLPRGLGNNFKYAMGSFISAASTIALNVFLIAGFNMGARGMFSATVLAQIITSIYLVCSSKVWRFLDIKCYKKEILKDISKYSLPLVPNQLCWWVIGASDRTIITYVLGVATNGVYSLANKFSSIYSMIFSIFNMSWTESVSVHINDEDREIFLTETINAMFALFSSFNFGIIAVIPLIFTYMVDKSYEEAYYQIPILMVAVLFQVIVGLFSVVYIALKKSKEITKTSVYAAIINLIINLIFIKYIGVYAASLSTLISFMVMAVYRYFHVKKYININLRKEIILNTVLLGIVVVWLYYYNHFITNVVSMFIVIIYFCIVNKSMLNDIFKILKARLKIENIECQMNEKK